MAAIKTRKTVPNADVRMDSVDDSALDMKIHQVQNDYCYESSRSHDTFPSTT